MPKTIATAAPYDFPAYQSITVERHEIVATIESGDGPRTMIEAAIVAASDYLANQDTHPGSHIEVQFRFLGTTWRMSIEVDDEPRHTN